MARASGRARQLDPSVRTGRTACAATAQGGEGKAAGHGRDRSGGLQSSKDYLRIVSRSCCNRTAAVDAVQQRWCAPIIDGLPAAPARRLFSLDDHHTPSHRIPRIASCLQQARRDHGRHLGAPGRDRLRRDGLGQDHATAEDRPRAGPRQAQRRARQGPAHRPHAAAPHCREFGGQAHRGRTEDTAGRRGRLQGALPGPPLARRLRQADDRRHPAGRDADRSAAEGLRHAHHRRGSRALAEHRLPAGLPARDPAAPSPT